jgi:hypothetical protein
MNLTKTNKANIQQILLSAWDLLCQQGIVGSDFTSETKQTEWNISHHYATAIASLLPGILDHDVDVRKPGYGDKRPDIIFHTRGTNDNNFLVVELKVNASKLVINRESARIMANWVNGLGYKYGAVLNVDRAGHESPSVIVVAKAE